MGLPMQVGKDEGLVTVPNLVHRNRNCMANSIKTEQYFKPKQICVNSVDSSSIDRCRYTPDFVIRPADCTTTAEDAGLDHKLVTGPWCVSCFLKLPYDPWVPTNPRDSSVLTEKLECSYGRNYRDYTIIETEFSKMQKFENCDPVNHSDDSEQLGFVSRETLIPPLLHTRHTRLHTRRLYTCAFGDYVFTADDLGEPGSADSLKGYQVQCERPEHKKIGRAYGSRKLTEAVRELERAGGVKRLRADRGDEAIDNLPQSLREEIKRDPEAFEKLSQSLPLQVVNIRDEEEIDTDQISNSKRQRTVTVGTGERGKPMHQEQKSNSPRENVANNSSTTKQLGTTQDRTDEAESEKSRNSRESVQVQPCSFLNFDLKTAPYHQLAPESKDIL